MTTSIAFIGDYSVATGFRDVICPAVGKNEWGMDTLVREVKGAGVNFESYTKTLEQGQQYQFAGKTWYLQTWTPIEDKIFPGYRLLYKGLFNGIPNPYASGQTIQQNVKITCTSPQNASRDITYLTRESQWKYITNSPPTGTPMYGGLDAPMTPKIIHSVIYDGSGNVYYGDAPAGLVTALTPVGVINIATNQANPVFGTPYFEQTDTVTQFLPPLS